MSTKKILYLTWNMELECPDDKCLKEISKRITQADPDLVVIGLQEAATYSTGKSKFIAHKLREDSYLGKSYKKFENSAHFSGITKPGQLLSSHAHQALQVMTRVSDKNTTVSTAGYQKSMGSEKGFCLGLINFYGKKLCCVSTHLEVKEKERAGDLVNIEKKLAANQYDFLVLMGDINYRIIKKQEQSENELKGLLFSADGRKKIIQTQDSFNAAHFNTSHLKMLNWPDFDDNNSLPTYKRIKVSKGSTARSTIESLSPGKDGTFDIKLLEKAYFPLKTKGDKFWDIGWLDRIGYSFNQKSGLSLVGNPKMHVWGDVPYGDHAPVCLLMEIDGFS